MTTIPLADLKAFLNVEGNADDETLSLILAGAETYTDGFLSTPIASMDPLPADLKIAVMALAGHYFEHRESTTVDLSVEMTPFGYFDLIRSYRAWSF